MVDLPQLTDQLMDIGRGEQEPSGSGERHSQIMSPGVVHLDFGDPDHVFTVTATRVPRVSLPVGDGVPLGEAEGVEVHLTRVRVDNYVTLTLQGRGAVAQEIEQEHAAATRDWQEQVVHDRHAPHPPWPAERLGGAPRLHDDVGTQYAPASGVIGGDGRLWTADWLYRPPPPAHATILIVETGASRVELALPEREQPSECETRT
jgi:hypothetical protein